MIHRPPSAVEAVARKRGAAKLRSLNREKALQVRYKMRDHYPGWGTRSKVLRAK